MTDRSERATLNHLIETCRDAERGSRAAADCVGNAPLKSLLLEMAAQRARFAEELLPHAHRLGGANDADGTAAAALHRSWMNLRHSMSKHDDVPMVQEAQRGEHFAIGTYRDVLAGFLQPEVREVIESQYAECSETSRRLQAFDHHVRVA
jgi:uncharacterized protein (TIGR02284 family)